MKKNIFLTTVILSSLSLITTNLIIPTSKAQAAELTECDAASGTGKAAIAGGAIGVDEAGSICNIADEDTVTESNFNFTYTDMNVDLTFTMGGDLTGRLTSITTNLTDETTDGVEFNLI